MSDITDVATLATRIQELETQLIRTFVSAGAARADTNCTNCDTNCTNCAGDRFLNVLLPGEMQRLSGATLVKQLRSGK